jgi:hypothetical protein
MIKIKKEDILEVYINHTPEFINEKLAEGWYVFRIENGPVFTVVRVRESADTKNMLGRFWTWLRR